MAAFLLFTITFHQSSSTTLTEDSLIPHNNGIDNLPDETTLTSRVHISNSEIVTIPTMGTFDNNLFVWDRTDCPHLQMNLVEWSTQFSQSSGDIIIADSQKIIIKEESLPSDHSFNVILIEAGGTLVFDDANINLVVAEIRVMGSSDGNNQGKLLIGSETCRLYGKISITLTGEKETCSISNSDYSKPSKGLVVDNGIVDIHGKLYHPTWTRLARTVEIDSDIIYLQDCVNWEVNQEILLTTTAYFDCPNDENLKTFCPSCYTWQVNNPEQYPLCQIPFAHQNEIFKIIGIESCNIMQLNDTTKYQHFASLEYQGEVALITRRINVIGSKTSDSFGGHIIVKNEHGEGRLSGIRSEFMGQLNVMGRYPFHFHQLGNGENAQKSYFKDTVVTNSQFRCYTVHGTNSSMVTKNIAYNVYGHCFYLEDGVEEDVEISYNLAAHVHPIYIAADGGGGQSGETFEESDNLLLPADTVASGYYIPNAYNNLTGNAASGGWSGFAFPNVPIPGNGEDYGYNNPLHRPNLIFDGNTAHSCGFYWGENGGCFYIGGWLAKNDAGKWTYNSGRAERDTYVTDTQQEEWNKFTNTKAFLCNKGISHWGNGIVISDYEVSDMLQGAQLFGESSIYNAIITARTDNVNGWSQQIMDKLQRKGFEFYGTGAKNILTQIEFRNFKVLGNPSPYDIGIGDAALATLDFSDKWSPQGINGIKHITFTNCDETAKLGTYHCGIECGEYHIPKAHNFFNIYDYDGSFIGTNQKTIIGSSSKWWDFGTDCNFKHSMNVWYCTWYPSRQIGYIDPYIENFNDDCYQDLADEFNPVWCNYSDTGTFDPDSHIRDDSYSDCSCAATSQFTAYSTGYISQWGINNRNKTADLSGWPGVTGIANTGWYWSTIFGAPSSFTIGNYFGIQLERGHFILLAMKYPSNAQFTVTIQYKADKNAMGTNTLQPTNSLNDILVNKELISDNMDCNSKVYSNSWYRMCDLSTTGGVGPTWYFDQNSGYFYLRIVQLMCYTRHSAYKNPENCLNGYFENNGVKIWDKEGKWNYLVEVECDQCDSQNYNGNTFYQIDDDVPPSDEFIAAWDAQPMAMKSHSNYFTEFFGIKQIIIYFICFIILTICCIITFKFYKKRIEKKAVIKEDKEPLSPPVVTNESSIKGFETIEIELQNQTKNKQSITENSQKSTKN